MAIRMLTVWAMACCAAGLVRIVVVYAAHVWTPTTTLVQGTTLYVLAATPGEYALVSTGQDILEGLFAITFWMLYQHGVARHQAKGGG
jgi:hypothetical protein